MVDGPGPKPSAKESRPVKVRQTKATKPTQEQAISLERSIEPRSLPSSEYATDALVKLSSEVPPAVDRKSPSTPSFAPVRATTQRTLSGSSPRSAATTPKAAIKHHANKPRHAVLGQDIIVHRKGAPLATSRTISPVVVAIPVTQPQALPPTSSLHAEKLHPVFSRWSQPKGQHALKATERTESYFKPASNLAFQPYPSAQGHQVRFQEADGKWLAQVQDVWGRSQGLPVVCARDQTPTQALQKLASKAPGQHKYWVHVLNTHQPPWAPRVVYVGALGLRGGMPVFATHGFYTTLGKYHKLTRIGLISDEEWERTKREYEAKCERADREEQERRAREEEWERGRGTREEQKRQKRLRIQEYALYEAACGSVKDFKETFDLYKDVYVDNGVGGSFLLMPRSDLPQNPSPLVLIQEYIHRVDLLIEKLAKKIYKEPGTRLHPVTLDDVCYHEYDSSSGLFYYRYDSDYSDVLYHAHTSSRAGLEYIKSELQEEKEVAARSEQAYFRWREQEELRRRESVRREQEERRARLDETHRREEERRRQHGEYT